MMVGSNLTACHRCEGKNTLNSIARHRKRQMHVLAQKGLHFPKLSSLTPTMVEVTMVEVTMVDVTMVQVIMVSTVVVNMVVVTMVEVNMLEKLA